MSGDAATPRDSREATDELADLAHSQAGAVSRAQVLAAGLSPGQIEARLIGRDWQPSGLDGVYIMFTGLVDYPTRYWAALLYAGQGATLGLATAGWIWGLVDEAPPLVDVMIPISRRVAEQRGLKIHHRLHLADRRHPAKIPPVTRIEETVLDLTERTTNATEVVDLVTRACQRRLTTAQRLPDTIAARKKLRWRQLLIDVLAEIQQGVQSALERNYLRDVETAHRLPRGARNETEGFPGRRRYRDVRYRRYRLVVELDGRAAHPAERKDRDDIRDNELTELEGTSTLRYGWEAIAGRPCETAAQVARLLRRGGWTGRVRPCGPGCPAASS